MSSTPYQANLTSAFDDTYTPSASTTADGGAMDGAEIYRRMQRPSKKPAWIAPVAGVVVIAAGAAVFLIQPKDEPVVPNIATTESSTTTRTAAMTPARAPLAQAAMPAGETVDISTSAPAPIRTARAAPAPRQAAPAPAESLTTTEAAPEPAPAPVQAAPAPMPAAPAAASETVVPSATAVNPAPEAPTSAPAVPAEAATTESQPASGLAPLAEPPAAPAQGDALAPAAVTPAPAQ